MRKIVAIIAMFGVLVGSAFLADQRGGQYRANTAKYNTEQADSIVIALRLENPVSSNPPAQSAYQQCQAEPNPELCLAALDLKQQIRMAIATEDVAVYALIGLGFTLLGLFMLWRTLHYTKKAAFQSGEAAATTKETLDIAEASFLETKSRTAIELRAYVTADTYDVRTVRRGDSEVFDLQGYLKWRNSGSTPVYSMSTGSDKAIIKQSDKNKIPAFDVSKSLALDEPGIFGKGGGINQEIDFTYEEAAEAASGKTLIVIYGAIQFTDVFGNIYLVEKTVCFEPVAIKNFKSLTFEERLAEQTGLSVKGEQLPDTFEFTYREIGPQNGERWIACRYPRVDFS